MVPDRTMCRTWGKRDGGWKNERLKGLGERDAELAVQPRALQVHVTLTGT